VTGVRGRLPARPGRALVVTVVHHPEDARIRHRQIAALLENGWQGTYAAPFSGYGLPLPDAQPDAPAGLRVVDLPRARGRDRLGALRAARALIRAEAEQHHLVLLHDPELLLAVRGIDPRRVVWDVHEDTAAALSMKGWLPGPLRRPTRWAVRRVEAAAGRRAHLLLAEDAYQQRFARPHPVVPNTTRVPASTAPPDQPRVVYIGHLTRARGAHELVALATLLHERTAGRIRVELVGHADASTTELLTASPAVVWHGFLPHDRAMALVDGALAGLSLLHDQPNYRISQPTKVVEYLAHGVPVITTPLPRAAELVTATGAGIVVPFTPSGAADPEQVLDAVLRLDADAGGRRRMGERGHAYAAARLDWSVRSGEFVSRLGSIAGAPRP
jgi:glycosyltransferase involved in cell wall biosynthesis